MRPRARREARTPPKRPLTVAHRGASFAAAEHTLSAYVAAIDSGADALECDVRLSRDGHLVCVHDRSVNRTSDGQGLVSELDLVGLNELDFSSWHEEWPHSADELLSNEPYLAGVAPDRDPHGGVLTLGDLLGLVRDASRPVQLLIETKHPTRYGGLVEKELVRELARFGWAGRPGPLIHAHRRLDRAGRTRHGYELRPNRAAPNSPARPGRSDRAPARATAARPPRRRAADRRRIAGPGLSLLRAEPEFVSRAHARGNMVYVWTVDEPADVEFVLDPRGRRNHHE